MIMDVQQEMRNHRSSSPPSRNTSRSPIITSSTITSGSNNNYTSLIRPVSSIGVKRSFDVAFLVAPDDKRRSRCYNYDIAQDLTQRSAFTKVNKVIDLSSSVDRVSPGSYSTTPSPPSPYISPIKFQHHQQQRYPFVLDKDNKLSVENYLLKSSTDNKELFKLTSSARPMLYPTEAYITSYSNYPTNFPPTTLSSPATLISNGNLSPTNNSNLLKPITSIASSPSSSSSSSASPTTPFLTAAAAVAAASLLPPSLAALSLPAQNVCAKCNLSFRMTSDLVYHMRSQHKGETTDLLRRRREEKLKCPVCSESFRERHHLTRHMTAHQDKAQDHNDDNLQLITTK